MNTNCSSADSSRDLELEITDLARGGAGVGRAADGRVVFVPYAAPGDRVAVRITQEEKRYVNAELIRILTPSPQRVEAKCAVFGKCGGCDWQHLPYSLQWKTKLRGLKEALSRAKVPAPDSWDELPAADPWAYRNRIQLKGHGASIGYYARGSKDLVPIERCEIADERLNAALAAARSRGGGLGRPYTVELEACPDGSIRSTWDSRAGAAGFRQVNDAQNLRLRAWVTERLKGMPWIVDLYGGDGNLSVALAPEAERVDVIDMGIPESPPPGTPAHVAFHRSAVLAWLRTAAEKPEKRQLALGVILDPPREGLGKDGDAAIRALRALGVRQVVCVGCDPDAWARDLAAWLRAGAKIQKIAALDLFPQTRHVEAVAHLLLDEAL